MGYMQEVDHWLEGQLDLWLDEKLSDEELKRSICDKILESYKNGLKAAGQSPAPRESGSPRRFAGRGQR